MLKKPTLYLIILALLFGVPLFGAFFMAKEKETLSNHTTNHGVLINPPLDFAILKLQNDQGSSITPQTWKGKWWMLYLNTTPNCDSDCDKNLYNMRQIKTALGKNSNRVERAILTFSDASPDQHLSNVLDVDFAGTKHFIVSKNDFTNFVQSNRTTKRATTENSIFVVDPLGNVMMIYSQKIPPMDIFKDLNRLLKLSRIG